jgi:8-oxo-dGTP pyrophosphatase MutT (NUDIX family)
MSDVTVKSFAKRLIQEQINNIDQMIEQTDTMIARMTETKNRLIQEKTTIIKKIEELSEYKYAVLNLIEKPDTGLILTVYNKRYQAYTLPGGKMEGEETVEECAARELREETGLETISARRIYDSGLQDDPLNRATYIHIVRPEVTGTISEMEEGCPPKWMSRYEFAMQSPFRDWTINMFQAVISPRGERF